MLALMVTLISLKKPCAHSDKRICKHEFSSADQGPPAACVAGKGPVSAGGTFSRIERKNVQPAFV
jgi:hypothetical protein